MPAFAAMGRRIERGAKRSWLRDGVSFARLAAVYRAVLGWLYRRPAIAVLSGCVLPVLGFAAATKLPEQFFSPTDRDQFRIEVTLSQQTPLAATAQTVLARREVLPDEPRIEETTWFLGETAPPFYYNILANQRNSPFYAQGIVQSDSAENSRERIRDVQRKLDGRFPEARVLVRQLELGPPFEAPVEVRIYGSDLDRLAELGESMRALQSLREKVVDDEQRDVDTAAILSPDTVRMSAEERDEVPAEFGASHARRPAAANERDDARPHSSLKKNACPRFDRDREEVTFGRSESAPLSAVGRPRLLSSSHRIACSASSTPSPRWTRRARNWRSWPNASRRPAFES